MMFLKKRIECFSALVPGAFPVIFLFSEIKKLNKEIKKHHPYFYFLHPLYFNEKRTLHKLQTISIDVKLCDNETIIIKKESKCSQYLKKTKAIASYRNSFITHSSWIERLSEK